MRGPAIGRSFAPFIGEDARDRGADPRRGRKSRPVRRAARRRSARWTGRGPRRDGACPSVWLSNRSKMRALISGGMPRPWSFTSKMTSPPRLRAETRMVWPGEEKPTALESRLNRIWRTRLPSATKVPMSSGASMTTVERGFREPVLETAHGGLDGGADVDDLRRQLQRTGVDGGEIENVVEDREQRRRRAHDVIGIFALARIERADRLVAEKLREADDVGERRAQLVGDVVHEFVAKPRGAFQRIVALGERALHVHARRHVGEAQERRAVGKRLRGAVESGAVAPLDAAGQAHAHVGKARHRAADVDPRLVAAARADGRS